MNGIPKFEEYMDKVCRYVLLGCAVLWIIGQIFDL